MKSIILYSLLLFCNNLSGQAGKPVTEFAHNGIFIDSSGVSASGFFVPQPDKKFLVNRNGYLSRYNQDGTPDLSFGNNGRFFLSPGASSNYFGLQSNGKIILLEARAGLHTIIRRNADASLDFTFGTGGFVQTGIDRAERPHLMALTNDDRIVVGGHYVLNTGTEGFQSEYLVRYTSEGALDPTFGTSGLVLERSRAFYPMTMAIQNDQKILLNGQNFESKPSFLEVHRYTVSGIREGDALITSNDVSNRGYSIVVQSDNKILIDGAAISYPVIEAGTTIGTGYYYPIIRYNSDGTPDLTFAEGGTVITGIKRSNNGLAVQKDNKIIVAGYDTLARFNPDGSLDQSFGVNGKVVLNDGFTGFKAEAVTITEDRIYLTGSVINGTTSTFAVAAFHIHPQPVTATILLTARFTGENASVCAGNEVSVSYLSNGVFNAGNVFTVYFFPAVPGGEANKTVMGTVRATTAGSMNVTIPANTPPGPYTIQVVSSSPAVQGSGASLVVRARPEASITVSGSVSAGGSTSAPSGLFYQYYEGSWTRLPDFGGLTPVASGTINNISLAPRKRDEQFAFLFEGSITVPWAGRYYFETSSDDGSRLYIGNYGHYVTPVVDNDGQHGLQTRGGWYTFKEAGTYAIAVSYFEQGGAEQLKVYWGSDDAGIPMHTPIPDAAFGPPPSAASTLTYAYYEGSWTQLPDFGGLTPVETGHVTNITLSPRKRDEQFAFLFKGRLTVPKAGWYYLETESDDGSRLYIGNYGHYVTPVVDNDGQHAALLRGGWYRFPAAGQYDIAVTFFEQSGAEQLKVYWGSDDAGIPMHTPIPDPAFATGVVGSCSNSMLTASEGDTYLWSTGETTRSITATQTGSYTVTVTKDGCTATSEPTLVSCIDNSLTKTTSKMGAPLFGTLMQGQLTVRVLPNPSATQFSLQVGSRRNELITLRILDAVGRVVEARNSLIPNHTLTLGQHYRPGVYYAEVVQGREKTVVKLVKGTE